MPRTAENVIAPVAVIVVGFGTVVHVLSPRRNVVLFAVPEPRRAVPTVPVERFDAFNDVRLAPEPLKDPEVVAPVTVNEPSVPTLVKDEFTTLEASVVPVNVLASRALSVCQVPSPRRNVVLFAVPVPRRAVPTVPDARLDAFNAVKPVPVPLNDVPVTAPVKLIAVPVRVTDEIV